MNNVKLTTIIFYGFMVLNAVMNYVNNQHSQANIEKILEHLKQTNIKSMSIQEKLDEAVSGVTHQKIVSIQEKIDVKLSDLKKKFDVDKDIIDDNLFDIVTSPDITCCIVLQIACGFIGAALIGYYGYHVYLMMPSMFSMVNNSPTYISNSILEFFRSHYSVPVPVPGFSDDYIDKPTFWSDLSAVNKGPAIIPSDATPKAVIILNPETYAANLKYIRSLLDGTCSGSDLL
jgi:hypothetical protein